MKKADQILWLMVPISLVSCATSEEAMTPTAESVTELGIQSTTTEMPPEIQKQNEISETILSGEDFNLLLSQDELPDLPDQVPGFERYDGADRNGMSGGIRRDVLRVFGSDPNPKVIWNFPMQGNNCSDAMWILRWIAENPDVLVSATNEVDIYGNVIGLGDNSWGERWAGAGIMSGSMCVQPGFRFAGTLNGNQSNLDDIQIEWSIYERNYFE